MHKFASIVLVLVPLVISACSHTPESVADNKPLAPTVQTPSPVPATAVPVAPLPVKIGLALGGGAARGFAHVGVIKVLEANGVTPDLIVGTSAGAVVGALYADGRSAAELQKVALQLQEDEVGDWVMPDRGVIQGAALQNFVNQAVNHKPLEKLPRLFGVVATDLRTGDRLLFRTGNTGMAVRASSAVPGVFKPVNISGREYVDGGLTSPVPVSATRELGADFVIAVDISARPKDTRTTGIVDVLLQTFTIMGQSLSRQETPTADILIQPAVGNFSSTDFKGRSRAIQEGEKAALAVLPVLKGKLEAMRYPHGKVKETP